MGWTKRREKMEDEQIRDPIPFLFIWLQIVFVILGVASTSSTIITLIKL